MLVSHKDKSIVKSTLSAEPHKVSRWMTDKKLSLHLGKMIKLRGSPGFNVVVGGTVLAAKKSVNYFGCVLDRQE